MQRGSQKTYFPFSSDAHSELTIGNNCLFVCLPSEKRGSHLHAISFFACMRMERYGEWISEPVKQLLFHVFSVRWRAETQQHGDCLSGVLAFTLCRDLGKRAPLRTLQPFGNFSKTQIIMKTQQERDGREEGRSHHSLNHREEKAETSSRGGKPGV